MGLLAMLKFAMCLVYGAIFLIAELIAMHYFEIRLIPAVPLTIIAIAALAAKSATEDVDDGE